MGYSSKSSLLSSLADNKLEMSRDWQVDANDAVDTPSPSREKSASTIAVLLIRFVVDVIVTAALSVLAYFMRYKFFKL